MSSKKTKRGESGGGKSIASAVEQSPPVTPAFEGNDPTTLPFPEWSDDALNAEKWDIPKKVTENV